MKRTLAKLGPLFVGTFGLAVLISVTPFAAPNPPQASPQHLQLQEMSWRFDRAGMFNTLLGRMDALIEQDKAELQIGTMAGIDLQTAVDARANLALAAKRDAEAVPARPSDDEVLALKARFDKALIEVDHAMIRFSVGVATNRTVASAIESAASVLR